MTIRCQIPTVNPSAKPTNVRKPVPQRRSSHCPANPGNIISATSVVICETHSIATASGGRGSPAGFVITGLVFAETHARWSPEHIQFLQCRNQFRGQCNGAPVQCQSCQAIVSL